MSGANGDLMFKSEMKVRVKRANRFALVQRFKDFLRSLRSY